MMRKVFLILSVAIVMTEGGCKTGKELRDLGIRVTTITTKGVRNVQK